MENVSLSNSQGERVPKLRFPGFEGEWEIHKLYDITSFIRLRKQGLKRQFISTENMKQNCSGIDPYIVDDVVEGIAFYEGDILIANIRPYLKKAWLASFSGICSTDVLAIHPTNVDPAFIYSSICRDSFFTYVMSGVKGSKMPRGDKSHIMDFSLGVPDIKEQSKIASFLKKLEQLIKKQRQLVELVKSYKRGVIQSVFSESSCGGKSAEKWTKKSIAEIFNCIIDKGHPEADVLTIIQGFGTTRRDTGNRRISYDKASVASYKKVVLNDFILHLRSFEGGLEIANETGIVSPAYTILRSKFIISPQFYYAYFRSYAFINGKLRIAVEGIRDGKSINMDTFWKITIPFPPFEEQKRFAKIFAGFDTAINQANIMLDKLDTLKQELLNKLFI